MKISCFVVSQCQRTHSNLYCRAIQDQLMLYLVSSKLMNHKRKMRAFDFTKNKWVIISWKPSSYEKIKWSKNIHKNQDVCTGRGCPVANHCWIWKDVASIQDNPPNNRIACSWPNHPSFEWPRNFCCTVKWIKEARNLWPSNIDASVLPMRYIFTAIIDDEIIDVCFHF
jgi:hypothetical protein